MTSLLIVCNSLTLGGAETLSIRLAQALAERGVPVALATPAHSPVNLLAQQAKIATAPLFLGPKISSKNGWASLLRSPLDFLTLERFLRRQLRERPDWVVLFQFKKEQFLGTWAARRLGVRVLWLEHGPLPHAMARWPWVALYRKAARWTSEIVAVSAAVKRSLEQHGVNPQAVQVIYPGIPPAFFDSPIGPATTVPLPDRPGAKVALVARLLENKGVDDFIDAAALLRTRLPSATFVIIGDGPDRQRLEHLARQRGAANVTFLGFRQDVAHLIRGMDILVSSSVAEGEGMPLRILEAMASGLAVVTTNIGGCGEALGEGRYGILVPPRHPQQLAEAIQQLIENPEKAKTLGREAQAYCRRVFSMENMARSWLELLRRPDSRQTSGDSTGSPYTRRVSGRPLRS